MRNIFALSLFLNLIFGILIVYLIIPENLSEYITSLIPRKKTLNKILLSDYYLTKKSIYNIMPNHSNEIIFVGNSIINNCNWNELFDNYCIKNRGIGGDIIKGVIQRLDEVLESKPQKIFVMIGINDLNQGTQVEEVLNDYEILAQRIIDRSPASQIYFQSILPVSDRPEKRNKDIIKINKGLLDICNSYKVTYIDLHKFFKNEKNEMNSKYSFDGLHPNGEGYLRWKKIIETYIEN